MPSAATVATAIINGRNMTLSSMRVRLVVKKYAFIQIPPHWDRSNCLGVALCRSWVNRCASIQFLGEPLSVVAPIGDKMVRRGECSDVPKADSCTAT
jgi:hypothetical protein